MNCTGLTAAWRTRTRTRWYSCSLAETLRLRRRSVAWVAERIRLGRNSAGDLQIVEALACADTMEREDRQWVNQPTHYPLGMGEESRRLHREYNRLVEAQNNGAKNGAELPGETDAWSVLDAAIRQRPVKSSSP
jgi:hypothetical protein